MRDLLACLIHGRLSRRELGAHMLQLGFGTLTARSILETIPAGKRQPAGETFHVEPFNQRTPYEQWMATEGVPIHGGFFIRDVRSLEVKPWRRFGVPGALIDLEGAEGTDGAYLIEIPPGARTHPQRFLFEEVLFVLEGEGETLIRQDGGPRQSVPWQKGSLFSPPLNTWRQHINRGRTPARLLSVNDLPVVMDLFRHAGFIFNNPFVFRDRYNAEPQYFTFDRSRFRQGGTSALFGEGERGRVSIVDAAVIPDVHDLPLYEARERGASNKSIEITLADNTLQTHLSEFEVGTYKRAHRHGPGSHVLILSGEGYTLMWTDVPRYAEAPKKVRIDWSEGSLFVPPDRWFHQHFNVGSGPAKYIATTWVGGKYLAEALGGGGRTHRLNTVSLKEGGNMVDDDLEDPTIRALFEEELNKRGLKSRMPPRPLRS